MRGRSCAGWSLIEHLVAMSLLGGILVSVLPVATQVMRESSRASARAEVLAQRWETVRRFRRDAALSVSARVLRASDGASSGVVLEQSFGSVSWASRDGLLHRAAAPGPTVQGAPIVAEFNVEARGGQAVVRYDFADSAGTVSGRVLLGSAR